jgi:hypothetical protein
MRGRTVDEVITLLSHGAGLKNECRWMDQTRATFHAEENRQ